SGPTRVAPGTRNPHSVDNGRTATAEAPGRLDLLVLRRLKPSTSLESVLLDLILTRLPGPKLLLLLELDLVLHDLLEVLILPERGLLDPLVLREALVTRRRRSRVAEGCLTALTEVLVVQADLDPGDTEVTRETEDRP